VKEGETTCRNPTGESPVRSKLASRPVASVAIHRATGGCEAYTARKQAVKIQLRNPSRLRMPTPLGVRKAASGYDRNCEGRPGIAGVPSSGHVSKDFPRTQESSSSPLERAVRRTPRETGGDRGWMDEQSYDPVVPAKVGNRRASERSGHGTHRREGGNKVTHLLKET
jgi:hypothetical protein